MDRGFLQAASNETVHKGYARPPLRSAASRDRVAPVNAADQSGAACVIERHYTTQEVAQLFALNPETIRREAARGHLRFIRIGKDLRFAASAVKEWRDSKEGLPA